MQYIKLRLVERFGFRLLVSADALLQDLDTDAGAAAGLYSAFEKAYETAEQYLPTRFGEYGTRSREAYFKVRNNFYHLFYLSEQVKKQFYGQAGILRVGISSDKNKDSSIAWVQADKWKLSIQENGAFRIIKEFPEIIINLYEIGLVIRGEIYGAVQKLMEPLYQGDRLRDFSFSEADRAVLQNRYFQGSIEGIYTGAHDTVPAQQQRSRGHRFKDGMCGWCTEIHTGQTAGICAGTAVYGHTAAALHGQSLHSHNHTPWHSSVFLSM